MPVTKSDIDALLAAVARSPKWREAADGVYVFEPVGDRAAAARFARIQGWDGFADMLAGIGFHTRHGRIHMYGHVRCECGTSAMVFGDGRVSPTFRWCSDRMRHGSHGDCPGVQNPS